jgi:hypothetical protein
MDPVVIERASARLPGGYVVALAGADHPAAHHPWVFGGLRDRGSGDELAGPTARVPADQRLVEQAFRVLQHLVPQSERFTTKGAFNEVVAAQTSSFAFSYSVNSQRSEQRAPSLWE